MSVDLNPHVQLGFPRPLTQLVKRSLQVSNPNNQPVAFKVKTTAPKQYCVRPNSGRIEPGEKIEVQVLLQPMKEEPPMSAKCRDKFLVQSTIITPERETVSLSDIWGLVEQEDKSQIHEQKIKCAFLPPASAPLHEEEENGQGSSVIGNEDRYQSVNNGNTINPVAAASNAASNTNGSTLEKARNGAVAAGGAVAAAGGAAAVAARNTASRATGGGDGDLQAEVTRLKEQLADATKRVSTQTAHAAEGVPVATVAFIVFAVFAMTYLFF